MNKIIIWITLAVAVLALVIGSVALVGNQPTGSQPLGAATPGTRFPNGVTVGKAANSPSNLANIIAGTCTSIIGADISQSASTTKPYDCAVTGAASGDLVFAVTSTSTTLTYGGFAPFEIVGAKASTTAGFITFMVANTSGAAAVLSAVNAQAGFASSTNYLVVRTQ